MRTEGGETYEALSSNSTKSDRQRERQLIGLMNLMALMLTTTDFHCWLRLQFVTLK